jgi:hypothetical protein
MINQWFKIYKGEARGVEYVEENSMTTAINFHLNGTSITVPGQANNLSLIKERDRVEICGRPALFEKGQTVCLAYRINDDENIHSINELRHVSVAILGVLFGGFLVASAGWKWPLSFVVAITIYYIVSSFWSFYARRCLARAGR